MQNPATKQISDQTGSSSATQKTSSKTLEEIPALQQDDTHQPMPTLTHLPSTCSNPPTETCQPTHTTSHLTHPTCQALTLYRKGRITRLPMLPTTRQNCTSLLTTMPSTPQCLLRNATTSWQRCFHAHKVTILPKTAPSLVPLCWTIQPPMLNFTLPHRVLEESL